MLRVYSKSILNQNSIVDDLKLNRGDFMDETNSSATFGDVSSVLSLMPGVQYNTKERTFKGPMYKKKNKMAINDYKIIAKSRDNPKVRYDAQEEIPQDSLKQETLIVPEVSEEVASSITSLTKKRKKGPEIITGDLTKSHLLQDGSLLHNVSLTNTGTGRFGHRRRFTDVTFTGKNNDYFMNFNGMRPTTAKLHYNNMIKRMSIRKSMKEIGNQFSIKQMILEDVTNFTSNPQMVERRNKSKNIRISAFNKFNNDILQGRVSNIGSGSQGRVHSAAYNTRPRIKKELLEGRLSAESSQRNKLSSGSRLRRISRAIKTSLRENGAKIKVKN